MLETISVAVVVAAKAACVASALTGDWFIHDLKPDGTPGAYFCGLGVDDGGTITWSLCRRDGPMGFDFGLEGDFEPISPDGGIRGVAEDMRVEAELTGCGGSGDALVSGFAVSMDKVPPITIRFEGRRMSPDEVDNLVRAFDDDLPEQGCRPEGSDCSGDTGKPGKNR